MIARIARPAAALGAAVLLVAGVSCTKGGLPTSTPAASAGAGSPSSTVSSSPGSTPALQSASWSRIPSPPRGPRQEVAAAIVDGKVYVIGGLVSNEATSRVEAYDPATRRWSNAPQLPVFLHHPMAVGFRGRLYVIGGILDRLGGADSDRVFMLDGSTWSEAPRLRRPRGAGAAVVAGDRIVVAGGIGGANEVAPVEIFDGTSWHDGAPIPEAVDHVGAATDGRYVYVAGGRRNGSHFNFFQRYDPAADTWQRLDGMPTARSGLGVAFAAGRVFAIGGEGPRIFPEVEAFDVASGGWARLPNMEVPRHGFGVVAIGTSIYTFVGGNRVGVGPSDACEVLTLN